MILVDSSVWIDHLRQGDATLAELLTRGRVLGHGFVTGEVALGSLRNRVEIIEAMQGLPQALEARSDEVMGFIDRHGLHGRGIGWVDTHLLASVRLTTASLWTRDRRLGAIAAELGMAFRP